MIKMKFTKKQYESLVKLVYLGNWMVNSIRTGKENEIKEYEDMEQYVYSFYKEAHLEKLIEFAPEFEEYFPTGELEMDSDASRYREEYENEFFWDELVDRLALRDLVREFGEKAVQEMDFSERFTRKSRFEEKYGNEFEKNGIDRLEIKE